MRTSPLSSPPVPQSPSPPVPQSPSPPVPKSSGQGIPSHEDATPIIIFLGYYGVVYAILDKIFVLACRVATK